MNIAYLPALCHGFVITIELTLCALVLGMLLALFWMALSKSRIYGLKPCAELIVFVIRGTPLLLQIFIIYYGMGQWVWIQSTFLWVIFKGPMACAIVALALNTSAYTFVLLKAAIRAIATREIEAAYALGLPPWKIAYRIILPYAMRMMLPAYSNEVVMVLKGTALVSTITLMDLMGVMKNLMAMTYQTIPLLLVTGVMYAILNGIIMSLFSWVEKKVA